MRHDLAGWMDLAFGHPPIFCFSFFLAMPWLNLLIAKVRGSQPINLTASASSCYAMLVPCLGLN